MLVLSASAFAAAGAKLCEFGSDQFSGERAARLARMQAGFTPLHRHRTDLRGGSSSPSSRTLIQANERLDIGVDLGNS